MQIFYFITKNGVDEWYIISEIMKLYSISPLFLKNLSLRMVLSIGDVYLFRFLTVL
jgi:hypothetical protein